MALNKRRIAVRTKPKAKPVAVKSRIKRRPKEAKGSYTGADGFDRAREVKQKQDQDYARKKETPFDFRLKPGESAELVLLDDEPFFVRLHNWQVGPKRWESEVCIADTGENCPLCSSLGKEGTFTLVMSAADRRQYKDRTGKTIKVSKKLVKAKTMNIPKFERLYKRHGTFRGLIVSFTRDTETEAAIGASIEYMNKKVSEVNLGKLKALGQPADYSKIFAMPSADELRERHHLDAPIGSEEFGKGSGRSSKDDDGPDDDIPW